MSWTSNSRTILRFLMVAWIITLLPTAIRCQASSPSKSQVPSFTLGLEIMSDPLGSNFSTYLGRLHSSIKEKAIASMPQSVSEGDRGVVSIHIQVQKDGTLANAPKFGHRSGNKTLDEHALAAIKSAVPFDHFPESISVPSVELRFTFYYNLAPSQP
jgi:TonB family protein